MTVPRKPDGSEIEAVIEDLKSVEWLGESRRRWPEFLCYFTDVRNAVNILTAGKLLARNHPENSHVMDCADQAVLAGTDNRWKQYVRLYFRPRTPMLYVTEGFKTRDQVQNSPHCPVPVYFFFDSKRILTRSDAQFSNGNLGVHGEGADIGDDAEFFRSLPFKSIYHVGSFVPGSPEGNRIKFHRHAEVIVPSELPLTDLRWIWCRSQAELETLRHLLPVTNGIRWREKMGVKSAHFNSERTYVTDVVLSAQQATFKFNPSRVSGLFEARVGIIGETNGEELYWDNDGNPFDPKDRQNKLTLSMRALGQSYSITLRLDGNLAYSGTFKDESDLF